ncbi:AraC family transcriptional regulator [Flagellimonas aquimarina]|jgi:AraC family transcriptional regulator|uniref:AraC family transcriptional regulator n=1 Tax=Flagellimonas aquimarina TaxID=2201895 RepID=A0A316L4D7_9FLAO|nr:AraC family transcriptional regulator [Allomuricauda koreensis]PWL39765.1 AraC family transcriptional regulator [Allomuricauda koreensis]
MKILTKGQYFGSQNSEISFNGVLLSQYTYTGIKTDWHYHENPYFMYVLSGNMKDCNTRLKTLCPSGSLMFNNWQEPHYGSKHSANASGFHLEFEKNWLKKNQVPLSLLEGSQLIENPRLHFLFAKLYREFLLSDNYSEVSVEVLLLQICETLSSLKDINTQNNPAWVDELKELLHYDTATLSLDYLSKELEVHPVHISRVASRYLSVSLGEYLRQHKIKKAIPLLLDPSKSLTEITYQVGFSDQSHFNRVFKSYFNMAPSAYRKSLKNF